MCFFSGTSLNPLWWDIQFMARALLHPNQLHFPTGICVFRLVSMASKHWGSTQRSRISRQLNWRLFWGWKSRWRVLHSPVPPQEQWNWSSERTCSWYQRTVAPWSWLNESCWFICWNKWKEPDTNIHCWAFGRRSKVCKVEVDWWVQGAWFAI